MIPSPQKALDVEEGALKESQRRAFRAGQIRLDPLFRGAVEAIKDDIWSDFARSKPDDDEARRMARLRLDVLDRVLGELNRHMSDGTLATKRLEGLTAAVRKFKERRANRGN